MDLKYGILDSGTTKSAVLKSFVTRNEIATIEMFMKLNILNSEMIENNMPSY